MEGGELDERSHEDAAIAAVAGRQRTTVTVEQLTARGLGKSAIKYRIRTGRYTVVFRGIVLHRLRRLPLRAREQAALLACAAGAFLTPSQRRLHLGPAGTHPYDIDVTAVGRFVRSRKAHAPINLATPPIPPGPS